LVATTCCYIDRNNNNNMDAVSNNNMDPAAALSAYFDACNKGKAKGFAPVTYRLSQEELIRFVARQLLANDVERLCKQHAISPANKQELATFIGGRCLFEHPAFVHARTPTACESQWYSAVDHGGIAADVDDGEVASGYVSATSS
jgi:hypothetical protein